MTVPPDQSAERSLTFGSPTGRLLLLTTILASGMAFLDGTVVNVALPRIEQDLGGGFAMMQWVLDSYLLTLGALVLVGGSLGDLLGRRRVFAAGILGFAVASVLCGLAPSAQTLILARGLQGIAAALMVPGSLALLSSLFVAADRGRAIGLWSGLSGILTAGGPFIGGWLVDSSATGWRWVFLLNVPLAAIALVLTRRIPAVPGTRQPGSLASQVDLLGAVLTVIGLGLVVGPLIEIQRVGVPVAVVTIAIGLALLVGFWLVEGARERSRQPPPMMPTSIWRIRSFSVANLVTFVVYGALGALLLLFTVGLQLGLGWSALAAGAAGLPITIMLAAFSSRVGAQIPRIGARVLLSAGTLIMASGMVLLAFLPVGASYLVNVFPGILLFAAGLTCVVAPITTTALGDIPVAASGVGSGVNNAVARVAGLVAIAVVPLMSGLSLAGTITGVAVLPGYQRATLMCAGLCVVGSVLSWFGFRRDTGRTPGRIEQE